jgi:Tetratricopeptide repeat
VNARSYYDQGQVEKAAKLEEEILEIRIRTQGPEHQLTLWSMNDLSALY